MACAQKSVHLIIKTKLALLAFIRDVKYLPLVIVLRILLEKCHNWDASFAANKENVTYLQKCKELLDKEGQVWKGADKSRQKIQVVLLGDRNCISIHTLAVAVVILGPLQTLTLCLWHNAEVSYVSSDFVLLFSEMWVVRFEMHQILDNWQTDFVSIFFSEGMSWNLFRSTEDPPK